MTVLYILGTNGSGKSALIHKYVQENRNDKRVRWIAAHRQTWLDSGATNFTSRSHQEHEEGATYDIVQMSDGERSTMIIAAQVITAEPGTVNWSRGALRAAARRRFLCHCSLA